MVTTMKGSSEIAGPQSLKDPRNLTGESPKGISRESSMGFPFFFFPKSFSSCRGAKEQPEQGQSWQEKINGKRQRWKQDAGSPCADP